ncbi:MAG: hypothetical protein MR717_03090 [Prevotella sp.]|nr:hypothetical protein [Prevotella sp.]MDD5895389.1 hypothetical protein [Prevotellaceae bacterium]
MAKRKELKQVINNICTDLAAEVVAVSLYESTPAEENIVAIINSILNMRRNYIGRISHVEPGMPAKKYFKDLIESFNNDTLEIIDHINNIN